MPLVFPCELITWKILPAVKAQMVKKLKKEGLTQKQTAKLLRVTESSVSQYVSGKRGYDFKIPERFVPLLDIALDEIKEDNKDAIIVYAMNQICNEIVKSNEAWEMYKELSGANEDCRICFTE